MSKFRLGINSSRGKHERIVSEIFFQEKKEFNALLAIVSVVFWVLYCLRWPSCEMNYWKIGPTSFHFKTFYLSTCMVSYMQDHANFNGHHLSGFLTVRLYFIGLITKKKYRLYTNEAATQRYTLPHFQL